MVQLELEPAFRMSSNLEHGYYSINLSTITVAHGTAMHIRKHLYNRQRTFTVHLSHVSRVRHPQSTARSIRLRLSYSPATSSRTADRAGDLAEIHHMHHTINGSVVI